MKITREPLDLFIFTVNVAKTFPETLTDRELSGHVSDKNTRTYRTAVSLQHVS